MVTLSFCSTHKLDPCLSPNYKVAFFNQGTRHQSIYSKDNRPGAFQGAAEQIRPPSKADKAPSEFLEDRGAPSPRALETRLTVNALDKKQVGCDACVKKIYK